MNGGVAIDRVPLSTAFELLSAPERRFALYALHWADDDAVAFDDLVSAVDNIEADVDTVDRCEDATNVAMWHNHLPTLSAAGVVEFDRRSDTVRYYEHPTVAEWLEHAAYSELPSTHSLLAEETWPTAWE